VATIFDQQTIDFISHSEAQTRRFGARLGELLQGGESIALQGRLGTGKTRWVQGMGYGLQIDRPITSPTFTLVCEYTGRLPLYHIDLYRIGNADEAFELGLEDYLYGEGVCVIEWAERIAGFMPPDHLWITFHHLDDTKRRITLRAAGQQHTQILQDFRVSCFATRGT
jgi:tRNA threonylcarbamoyladenosine biosynthesis protein TsaE